MSYYTVQKMSQLVGQDPYQREFIVLLPMNQVLRNNQVLLVIVSEDVGQKCLDLEEANIELQKFERMNPTWTYRLVRIIE